jgi:hypothetical protein
MPLQNPIAVDIGEEQPIALPAPCIVWPTMVLRQRFFKTDDPYESGDLNQFPDEDCYRERYRRGIGGVISRAFQDEVRIAQHRIWILDEQILRNEDSAKRLGELFFDTGAWDLRVITASREGAKDRARWLKGLEVDLQARIPTTRIRMYLDFNSKVEMPEIHDRFAIIDDVLWHCGATVGGMHNAINAMTFGWSAHTTNAVAFFEKLCVILGEFP